MAFRVRRRNFAGSLSFRTRTVAAFERFQAKYNMLVSGSGRSTLASGSPAHSTVALDTANFLRQVLDRQCQQGVVYSEQRSTLSPRHTQDQARELLLTLLGCLLGIRQP